MKYSTYSFVSLIQKGSSLKEKTNKVDRRLEEYMERESRNKAIRVVIEIGKNMLVNGAETYRVEDSMVRMLEWKASFFSACHKALWSTSISWGSAEPP